MTTDSPSTNRTPLHGPWLTLARVIWVAIVLLLVVLWAVALPARMEYLQTVCVTTTCPEPYRRTIDPAIARVFQASGLSPDFAINAQITFELIFVGVWWLVGALIFWRKSHDRVAWFVSLTLVTFAGAAYPDNLYWLQDHSPVWRLPAVSLIALGDVAIMLFICLFPDGRFVPRWALILFVLYALVQIPARLFPASIFATSLSPLSTFPLIIGALVAQLYRYRRESNVIQQKQTKWVALGMAMAIGGFIGLGTLGFTGAPTSELSAFGLLVVSAAYWSVLLPIPVSIAFSILHYRLWDIDFLINRSLVYGALTALLIALFGGSLLVINALFQHFAGGPLVAVAASAVLFGAVFQPARRRLQRFVDRRFYNIQIDYQKTPLPIPAATTTSVTHILKQTHFGAYQSLQLIGRGGMAEVYKATHPMLGTPVAIKILPAHLAADPDFRKRFVREAETIAKLQHPNIVRVFDFGELDGTHYMVMEYITGKDLGGFLREQGRLSLTQALPILRGIASALDYAHAQGLVHRDIKPANVMLDTLSSISHLESFRAVLTDFGIAKILGLGTHYTQTGSLLGTFDYIAPEQIQGAADVDERADVYALGVMAYQMLTGKLPFQHHNPGALLMAHLTQPPPDPCDLVPNLPSSASFAIRRAMAKNPDERNHTAGEFVAACER